MMRLATTVLVFVLLCGAPPAATSQQQQSHPATADKTAAKPAKAAAGDSARESTSPSADGQTPKKKNADDNPFPEEQSKSAAKGVEAGQTPAVPTDLAGDSPATDASGHPSDGKEGTSSDEGVSSSRTRLEGLDDADPDLSRKGRTTVAEPVHNPKLSSDDVAIGKMYFQSENYRGAYVRYREALSLDPENADAAFGVAEAACKLSQLEEARQNYKLCVDLDPDGPRAKAARKALATLASKVSR